MEKFKKILTNISESLEKYCWNSWKIFQKSRDYCGEFGELFYNKIILKIISAMFENHFKKFQYRFRNILDTFEKYFGKHWEILPKKSFE